MNSKRIRPLSQSTGVKPRGCSRPLQRAITDFGADLPYARAMDKLVEHYGVIVAESTIARVTQKHARVIAQCGQGKPLGLPKAVAPKQTFIAQMDGIMVPTVKSCPEQKDDCPSSQRKLRQPGQLLGRFLSRQRVLERSCAGH